MFKNIYFRVFIKHYQLIAWSISLAAVIGSLYFSEILGYSPCNMCWYQRIAMYPLVVILGLAIYKGDKFIDRYVIFIGIIGMFLSLVHYIQQKIISNDSLFCFTGIPCDIEYINMYGFITIPLLAFFAFLLITLVVIFGRTLNKQIT